MGKGSGSCTAPVIGLTLSAPQSAEVAELEALLEDLSGLEDKAGGAETILRGITGLLEKDCSEQILADIDEALLDLAEMKDFLEVGLQGDYDRFRLLRAKELASVLAVGESDTLKSPPSLDQLARILGFSGAGKVPGSGTTEKKITASALARICRVKHFSKGLTADYLEYHLAIRFKKDTLDKWCAAAEFPRWYSRTESIELRHGSEDYERQRARWLGLGSRARDALMMRATNLGTLECMAQDRYDDLFGDAQDKIRGLIKKSFHKAALHKPARESANGLLTEELFSGSIVKGVLDEVAHAHCAADPRTAVEKPFEHGIRGGLSRMTGVEIEEEGSRSDPMDVRFTANGDQGKLTAQVKTRYSTTPETAKKHAFGHENELERHSFTLFDTGPEEAADGKRLAQKAAERLDDTDLYIECNVLNVNDGLTGDDQPDTTKYAIDVMRREAKDEIASQLRGHDFNADGRLEAAGVVTVNGSQIPWKATVSKRGNGVRVSLSPQAMEPAITLSAPSPEIASGLVLDEAMRSYSHGA